VIQFTSALTKSNIARVALLRFAIESRLGYNYSTIQPIDLLCVEGYIWGGNTNIYSHLLAYPEDDVVDQ